LISPRKRNRNRDEETPKKKPKTVAVTESPLKTILTGSLEKKEEKPEGMLTMKGNGGMDEFGRFTGGLGFMDGSEIRNASPSFAAAPKGFNKTKIAEYNKLLKDMNTGKFIADTCFAREKPAAAGTPGKRVLLWVDIDKISIHFDTGDKTLGKPFLFT
jgi:hypothetical protein